MTTRSIGHYQGTGAWLPVRQLAARRPARLLSDDALLAALYEAQMDTDALVREVFHVPG